jgi:hypothetical protein
MNKYSLGFFAVALAAGAAFGSIGSAQAASVGSGGTTSTVKPTQVKPAPVKADAPTSKQAPKLALRCGNLATMQARVRCRLQLSAEELEAEYKVQYLPEECRAIAGGAERSACVDKYRSFQPCWSKPVGDDRVECAQQVLGLTKSTDELVRQCRGNRTCQLQVQEKVYDLIKFRFYELEERAEELLEDGAVDLDAAVSFVAAAEEQKAAFNAATDNRERQQIIYAVRRAWQNLVDGAKRAKR